MRKIKYEVALLRVPCGLVKRKIDKIGQRVGCTRTFFRCVKNGDPEKYPVAIAQGSCNNYNAINKLKQKLMDRYHYIIFEYGQKIKPMRNDKD